MCQRGQRSGGGAGGEAAAALSVMAKAG